MTRIPKIIHYCWLSGEPFPETIAKCIDSWKKHMPDYEFVLWDTNKFDVHSNLYVEQAFEAKKYAFASDYIRLYALYHYGGIYLDSDIQVFKRFDDLLNAEAFTCFEDSEKVAAWIFASEKGNPLFAELLAYYDNRSFLLLDGKFDMTPNVVPVTETFINHGLILDGHKQELDHITVYPRTYFCPMIPDSDEPDCYSENTYAQHLFNGGWIDAEQKVLLAKKRELARDYGELVALIYYGVNVIKRDGFVSFCREWGARRKNKKMNKKAGVK